MGIAAGGERFSTFLRRARAGGIRVDRHVSSLSEEKWRIAGGRFFKGKGYPDFGRAAAEFSILGSLVLMWRWQLGKAMLMRWKAESDWGLR